MAPQSENFQDRDSRFRAPPGPFEDGSEYTVTCYLLFKIIFIFLCELFANMLSLHIFD